MSTRSNRSEFRYPSRSPSRSPPRRTRRARRPARPANPYYTFGFGLVNADTDVLIPFAQTTTGQNVYYMDLGTNYYVMLRNVSLESARFIVNIKGTFNKIISVDATETYTDADTLTFDGQLLTINVLKSGEYGGNFTAVIKPKGLQGRYTIDYINSIAAPAA